MRRFALEELQKWADRSRRKPLIVRGARQVGKSTLVRMFGGTFESFVELNFERDPSDATLFQDNRPARILSLLEVRTGARIEPGKTLLFLDEIQAAPAALRSLRYFHEELPDLHVIAAGSLLEIAAASLDLPMPVGRVEFLHLGPMQFEEFADACGAGALVEMLARLDPSDGLPDAIHRQASELLRTYLAVGGMPEVVAAWRETRSLRECDRIKQSILITFEADFSRYGSRIDHARLGTVFRALPARVGSRFKYAHVDRHLRSKDLAAALDLLCLARVAARVPHSASNGPPLDAETNSRQFKVLFLDVGLVSRSMGLDLVAIEQSEDVVALHAGAIAEQFVGQHLLYSRPTWEEPRLHFWAREQPSSTAEVDYVLSVGARVVPVEVKAGSTGRLKSLHMFVREKHRDLAIRLWSGPPSTVGVRTALPVGDDVPFTLVSLPLYMVGQARRIIREMGAQDVTRE